MKIIFRKTLFERIQEEVRKATIPGKDIEKIELTAKEAREWREELRKISRVVMDPTPLCPACEGILFTDEIVEIGRYTHIPVHAPGNFAYHG